MQLFRELLLTIKQRFNTRGNIPPFPFPSLDRLDQAMSLSTMNRNNQV